MKQKFEIIERAKRQAIMCFSGIAIPHQPTLANDVYGPIKSEKLLKFNRSALKKVAKETKAKVDARLVGGEDRMKMPVGKPGSKERVDALIEQYSAILERGEEISPFA